MFLSLQDHMQITQSLLLILFIYLNPKLKKKHKKKLQKSTLSIFSKWVFYNILFDLYGKRIEMINLSV